ncbi:MAG: DUF542 domain-containing protein [Pyrinomonadaceae bacterium]
MSNFDAEPICEIARKTPAAIDVFEKFNIDYYCHGNRSFDDACQSAGVDPLMVCREIEGAVRDHPEIDERLECKTAFGLVDHIVERHHTFTRDEAVRLSALFDVVCRTCGNAYPEFVELQRIFKTLCNDLFAHMKKEETVLFPHIKNLEASQSENASLLPVQFESVKNQSRMLRLEHEESANILRKMRKISADYGLPETASSELARLYDGLRDFECDVHLHIHLENNVLFPLAAKIEDRRKQIPAS